jgi:hypothetical protein
VVEVGKVVVIILLAELGISNPPAQGEQESGRNQGVQVTLRRPLLAERRRIAASQRILTVSESGI